VHSSKNRHFLPELKSGDIPEGATFDESAPVFVMWMPYMSSNLGHLMYDELLPFFTLMRMFNLLVRALYNYTLIIIIVCLNYRVSTRACRP
jgi:hypothetical protein